MDQPPQPSQQQMMGGVPAGTGPPQMPYPVPAYQPGVMVTGAPAPPAGGPHHQLAYQQVQQFHQQQQQHQQQQLQSFWADQMREIDQTADFKNHSLPLARIKKIMKADEDVRMISAEAPVVFAKACELFILELTLRAWIHTEENKRRTLQKNDIAAAIGRTDIFDFLVDIVPRDELKEEGLLGVGGGVGGEGRGMGGMGGMGVAPPFYYMQPGMGGQGGVMGGGGGGGMGGMGYGGGFMWPGQVGGGGEQEHQQENEQSDE
ncbi:hypothetical protein LUZ60_009002 [Juncus effusus]|nr:hypothetical protein LUZ60_009002 [Juncus effusus]